MSSQAVALHVNRFDHMKVQYPLHKFPYLNVHRRLFTVVSRVCAAPVGQDRICQMRSAVASLFPKSELKIFTENPAQVPILTCSLEAIYRRLQSLRGGCRSGPSLRHPHVLLPTSTYIESNPSNTTVTGLTPQPPAHPCNGNLPSHTPA